MGYNARLRRAVPEKLYFYFVGVRSATKPPSTLSARAVLVHRCFFGVFGTDGVDAHAIAGQFECYRTCQLVMPYLLVQH